ncbi:MAG: polysaccharide biosynthesis tyrosine autokinase [Chloroflexota bacterium]|nr:polysaccharide biosynthesis tyrosine autokinase [Chloroflexota bacterium]
MEPRWLTAVILRWWWVLLIGMAVGGASAWGVSQAIDPTYRATATILVNQSAAPGTVTYSDALLSQQLVKTYARMASQRVVLEQVARELELAIAPADLDDLLTGVAIAQTQLLEIRGETSDPELARDLANTAARVFIEQQQPFLPAGREARVLRVAQPAAVPTVPIAPRPVVNTVVCVVAGLLAAVAIAGLLEYRDDTIKSPDDVQELGLAPLGVVGILPGGGTRKARVGNLPPTAAEAYRKIRTGIDLWGLPQPVRLLVTSAGQGEGKSTTAASLAHTFGQLDRRVVLVDGDLRRPQLHRLFGLRNTRGLSSLLVNPKADSAATLRPTAFRNVSLLAAGASPPNATELLASARMREVLDDLAHLADVVIVDSPPALGVSDPVVLAATGGAVVLVAQAGITRPGALLQARDALLKTDAVLLGAVINAARPRVTAAYYGDYAYGAGPSDSEGAAAWDPSERD